MGLDVRTGNDHEVACPHCKKRFAAQLISGRRSRGFKCPHCRLFVPLDRSDSANGRAKPGRAVRPGDEPLARDSD